MLLDVASLSTCFYHSKLHGQVDEYRADSNKERKLRERAEQYSRELEQEIEAAKRKNLNRGPTASHLEMSQEISRFGQNLNALRCRNVLKNLKIHTDGIQQSQTIALGNLKVHVHTCTILFVILKNCSISDLRVFYSIFSKSGFEYKYKIYF